MTAVFGEMKATQALKSLSKNPFCWGEEKWYIPAVYICDKGLVIDYCKQADPVQVKAFIDKWDLLNEGNNHYTKEQQEQIERGASVTHQL